MSRLFLMRAVACTAPLAIALTMAALVAVPASPTLASTSSQAPNAEPTGAQLYQRKCAICHDKGGSGTFMLERRPGMTKPILAERTDLRAPFVKTVVRNGMVNMPALTKVELSDAQLDAIANYLQSNPSSAK